MIISISRKQVLRSGEYARKLNLLSAEEAKLFSASAQEADYKEYGISDK